MNYFIDSWELDVEYGFTSQTDDDTFHQVVACDSEAEAIDELKKLVEDIKKDNASGSNSGGLYLVGADIRFHGEVDEDMIQGATYYDVKEDER